MNRIIGNSGWVLCIVSTMAFLGCDRTPQQDSRMDHMKDSMSESAEHMKDSARDATDRMQEGAGQMKDSAAQYLDDATLTARVKERLAADTAASTYRISVETREGAVQLSGSVPSQAEKLKAGEIAAGVDGVRSVQNDLVVTPPSEGRSDDHRKHGLA